MKKDRRLLKIDDNFSAVEIYLNDSESPGLQNFTVLVIVSSRTFSGRYTCRFSREEVISFSTSSIPWLEKLSSEMNGVFDEKISFAAVDNALRLEVKGISSTKVSWTVTCQPFLKDIEVLQVRLETETNLVRRISAWSDTNA